ncbi:Pentatricopeptide repeat-containing protein [Thalictrum thalictroides]|uniref:Pentatricopeptide repeat-containing protein n=1 Tax=Thalictrum thalictroides TaxID=46969 RepID=A0A7J6V6M4_THATH|nr:Pentatricopeptide repeat-containing protein [Thalictrum thalictroides]
MFVVNYVEIAEFFVMEVLEKHEYDESSYNVLISIYTKYGMCEDAIMIAEKAKARFEKLGLGFYACLMDVYKVNGDMREAMKTFMEMEDKGIVADEGIYMALLGIFCRGGSVKLCSVVLEEMRQVGCRPDEGLRMDLMKLFLKEGMVCEAEILAKDEFLKDSESMPAVVEAMADKGRPLEALEIIKNMRKSGKNVDGCVYASLIHGCGRNGLIEDAEKVFEDFKLLEGAENAEKFESVYTSMVYLYSKTEMREKAEMFFNQMEGELGFAGSEKVFSYMMSMYGALGLFNDVERMFERWKRSCFSLNVDAYAFLLEALSKSGKMNRARDFLFEMRSSGMHPNNSIYLSLMEGYLLLGLVNHAVVLLDEYKLLGLEMDDVMASSVIGTLIQAGRYMDLGVYLEKMTRQGITIPQDKGMFLVKMCGDSSCLEKLGKLLQ